MVFVRKTQVFVLPTIAGTHSYNFSIDRPTAVPAVVWSRVALGAWYDRACMVQLCEKFYVHGSFCKIL